MKIRDLILVILVLSILINSVIIVGFTSTKLKKISDATSETSYQELQDNAGKGLLDVSLGLRDSLDNQLESQYTQVKLWAKNPLLIDTSKQAQDYTKEQLYEMWSAEATRVYSEGEATGDGNPTNDLNPKASEYLITTSQLTGTYPEIFTTDNKGYAIAANGATGDFDQGPSDWRIFKDELTGQPYFKQNKPGADQEPWYYATNQAPDGFYVSDVSYDESTKTWGLEIISQIKDAKTNEYLGQIKAVFDYSKFVKNFVSLKDVDVEEVKIVTSNGDVVASSKSTQTTTELNKVSNDFLIELKKGKTSGVFIETTSDGKFLTSYAVLNDKNHHIVSVSKKYENVNAPINSYVANLKGSIDNEGKQLSTSIMIIALIVGIITLALGFAIVNKRISTPLNKLTTVSEKLAKGEMNGLEVDVKGNDEIGKLGDGFKGVVAAFNLMHDELSKKEKK